MGTRALTVEDAGLAGTPAEDEDLPLRLIALEETGTASGIPLAARISPAIEPAGPLAEFTSSNDIGLWNQFRLEPVPVGVPAPVTSAESVKTAPGRSLAPGFAPEFVPSDPLYANQWHFDLMGNGGGRGFIEAIWDEFTGAGVHVGIYDVSVQITHHDLDDNYDPSLHVLVGGVPAVPLASPGDAHGTAVAGIIGAEANNGAGGVGIAFGSSLTSVGFLDSAGPITTTEGYLAALDHIASFDITSNSWGYPANYDYQFNHLVPGSSANLEALAFADAVETGRGGLGTIIVKSAGNSNVDTAGESNDGLRYTLNVAALLETGFAASYSNFGLDVLVSAAGGDNGANGTRLITTTDLLGTAGYNTAADPTGAQDFTDRMNGTSSAAPMVSGVVALMLDANPDLGWRDVQNILAMTAFQTGSGLGGAPGLNENHSWFVNAAGNWNGGGMHFSNDYGYGNVDPFGAVRMAEAFAIIGKPAQTSANELSGATDVLNVNLAVPDNNPGNPVTFDFVVDDDLMIDHVTLTLNFNHTSMGQLGIKLVSAEGTELQVKTPRSYGLNFSGSWEFGIDALRGELSAGTWTLKVYDTTAGYTGTINTLQLTVYGQAANPADDVYHFTDEFSAMAGLDPSRGTVNDTDGGIDWLNMAAVSGGVVLNLNNGASSFLTIGANADIENAITGDGNDAIAGNALANILHGMRGNDTLNGGMGNDTLDGGAGGDALNGEGGIDTVSYATSDAAVIVNLKTGTASGGHAEADILSSIEKLIGSIFNDLLTGMGGRQTLFGGDGNDILDGLGANDRLVGELGADQLFGRAGADRLEGDGGADVLNGGGGNDTLLGGNHNDILIGGAGADVLNGGSGHDTASYADATSGVSAALDGSIAGTGDALGDTFISIETLEGSRHNDTLIGDTSGNTLRGMRGDDNLSGGGGADTLEGSAGNDRITGGLGADILSGGIGNDTFVYDALNQAGDVITDFSSTGAGNNDRFEFLGTAFGNLAAGGLLASQFQNNGTSAAANADVRFIYNVNTQQLFFDSDGNGGNAAVLLATLQPGATMNLADFLIV